MAGESGAPCPDHGSLVLGVDVMEDLRDRLLKDDVPFGRSQREALKLASRQFLDEGAREKCERVKAVYEKGLISLPFLGRPLRIKVPDMEFSFDDGRNVPLWLKVLALHHLNTSKGSPLSGELVAFRNLPGGQVYHPNFEKRVSQRVAREFGDEPARLTRVAPAMNGSVVPMGDAGLRIYGFPRVPLTFIVWGADEEFPASASVLFDAHVLDHLPVEDVVVIAQEAVTYVVRAAREIAG